MLTEKGATLEFQHSHLSPDERAAREAFYKNLVWIVDGSRLKRDLLRFVAGARYFKPFYIPGVYLTALPAEAFPRDWLSCNNPVVFDFKLAAAATNETPHIGNDLWCLLPTPILNHAVVWRITRQTFVRRALEKTAPIPVQAIIQRIEEILAELERRTRATAKAGPRYRVRYVAPKKTRRMPTVSRSRRRF